MQRQSSNPLLSTIWMLLALAVVCFGTTATASAQTARMASDSSKSASPATIPSHDDPAFEGAYHKFYTSYRLGPGDVIAVRIQGHLEYSREAIKVSPVGAIYLELLGDVAVAGMTIQQSRDYLTKELSEYLRDPKVTVSLVEALSAKIAILGDVLKPGIVIMTRPMNLMDAIIEAGGFTPTGSKSNVELIRDPTSGSKSKRIDVKRILASKATAADNVQLQPGDIVYVHGNMLKKISTVTALSGFGGFTSFMTFGRQGK
ncbi:MAG: polysaccharide biosynthesis/export family protein [Blastocatellia bacterium]